MEVILLGHAFDGFESPEGVERWSRSNVASHGHDGRTIQCHATGTDRLALIENTDAVTLHYNTVIE